MRAEPSLADDEPPASGSASCAPATLDEPSGHSPEREIEDVPRADGDEDEDPFTEDEVLQMHEEIRELAAGMYTNKEELDNFLGELDSELQENGDLQERRSTAGGPSSAHTAPLHLHRPASPHLLLHTTTLCLRCTGSNPLLK